MTLLFLEQLLKNTRVDEGKRGCGLFEAEKGQRPTTIFITEKLGFVPAAFKMRNTEVVSVDQFSHSLSTLLDDTGEYDLVLVDAQAGTDPFAQRSAEQSDVHLIVSEYDPVSAQGVDRLKIIFSEQMTPSDTFILFNKVLPEFAAAIGEGLAIARYLPPIPWDADVVRAFARRDLAISIEAPNPYTLAISQVCLSCLPDLTGPKIESWRGEILERDTDPIRSRLFELYSVRDNILQHQYSSERLRRVGRMLPALTLGLISFLALSLNIVDMGWEISSWGTERVIIVMAGVGFLVATMSAFLTSRTPYISWEDMGELRAEIAQLEASVRASEAALKASEPGPFSILRRREIHG
jgi:cellulose biosynthesis protein BcsQ